jgi:hypothetical protein
MCNREYVKYYCNIYNIIPFQNTHTQENKHAFKLTHS